MVPDLTFLVRLWRQRAGEQRDRARQLGPTFDGKAAMSAANAIGQCADELLRAIRPPSDDLAKREPDHFT